MKYKFIELKDICADRYREKALDNNLENLSLFFARSYHDDKDTCIYLLSLRYKDHQPNRATWYHYKIFRLYNNQLDGPHYFHADRNLSLTLHDIVARDFAKSIDNVIEQNKHAQSCLDHAKTVQDGDFSSPTNLGDVINNLREVAIKNIASLSTARRKTSGYVIMSEDNSWPEKSSPTGEARPSSKDLTRTYSAHRYNGDVFRSTNSGYLPKSQPKMRNPVPMPTVAEDEKSIAFAGRPVIFSKQPKMRNPAFRKLDFNKGKDEVVINVKTETQEDWKEHVHKL